MAKHLLTGAAGEQLACQWLQERGFVILHRNWRHKRDELDIVAKDGRFLVVIEVKTLGSDRWHAPELAVDRKKQRTLIRAAEELIHQTEGDLELRFDVISVTFTPEGSKILHIPNAFYPTLDDQTQ
ncbi:MAG: YraN family protein [Flavobacteriales bacterium]|nr:YraN family protein [Flavobacteriales bacterium]MBL0046435.1 YraN family protein [Flavobacteriales bacterium]